MKSNNEVSGKNRARTTSSDKRKTTDSQPQTTQLIEEISIEEKLKLRKTAIEDFSTKVILEKIDAKCDEDIQYKTTFFDESLSLRGLQLIKKEANKISLVDIIENEIKKIKLSDLDQKNPTKNFTKKIINKVVNAYQKSVNIDEELTEADTERFGISIKNATDFRYSELLDNNIIQPTEYSDGYQDYRIINNWLNFIKEIHLFIDPAKWTNEFQLEEIKKTIITTIREKASQALEKIDSNNAKKLIDEVNQEIFKDYSNSTPGDFLIEKSYFNRAITSIQGQHELKLIEDKLNYLAKIPANVRESFKEEDFPDYITNRAEKPFITFNGVVVFSITEEQRKILTEIDQNFKNKKGAVVNINLKVGKGKSYMCDLIEKIYGKEYNESRSVKPNNNQRPKAIDIGQAKAVAYPLEELTKQQYENNIRGLKYSYKANEPIYIHSLSLSEIYDLEGQELLDKVDKIIQQEAYALVAKGEELAKYVINLENETTKIYEDLEKLKTYINNATKISNPTEINELIGYANSKLDGKFELKKGTNRQQLRSDIESFLRKKQSLLDKKIKDNGAEIEKKSSEVSSILKASKDSKNSDSRTRQLIIIDEFEHLDQEQKKKLRLYLLSKNYQVVLVSATPNTKALEEDLIFYKYENPEDKDLPLTIEERRSEIKIFKNAEEIFKQQITTNDNVRLRESLLPILEKSGLEAKNIIDLLIQDVGKIERGKDLKKIQLLLPDIKADQIQLLMNDGIIQRKIAEETGIRRFVIKNGKQNIYWSLTESENPENPDPISKNYEDFKNSNEPILMIYSSSNCVGGDFGDYSRDVYKQIIYSVNNCSTSLLQQWFARNRKNDMDNLGNCQRILRIGNREYENKNDFLETIIFEEKKRKDSDALHRARTRIVRYIENALGNKIEKEVQKELFKLIRKQDLTIDQKLDSLQHKFRIKFLDPGNQPIPIREALDLYEQSIKNLTSSPKPGTISQGSKLDKLLNDLSSASNNLDTHNFRKKFAKIYETNSDENEAEKLNLTIDRSIKTYEEIIEQITNKIKNLKDSKENDLQTIQNYLKSLEDLERQTKGEQLKTIAAQELQIKLSSEIIEKLQKERIEISEETNLKKNEKEIERLEEENSKLRANFEELKKASEDLLSISQKRKIEKELPALTFKETISRGEILKEYIEDFSDIKLKELKERNAINLKEIETEKNDKEEQIKKLKAEIEKIKKESEEYKILVNQSQAINNLFTEESQARNQLENLLWKEIIDELHKSLSETKQDEELIQTKTEKSQLDYESQQQIINLQEQITKLEQEKSEITTEKETEIQQQQKIITRLRDKESVQAEQIVVQDQKIATQQIELNQVKTGLQTKLTELELELQSRQTKVEEITKSKAEESETKSAELAKKEQELAQKIKEIGELKKQLNDQSLEYGSENSILSLDLANAKDKAKELETKLVREEEQRKLEVEKKEKELSDAQNRGKQLEANLETANREREALLAESKQKDETLAQLKEQIGDKDAELNQAKSDLEVAEQRAKQEGAEKAALQAQLPILKAEIEKQRDSNIALIAKVESDKATLEESQKKLLETTAELEEASGKITKLTEENSRLRDRIEQPREERPLGLSPMATSASQLSGEGEIAKQVMHNVLKTMQEKYCQGLSDNALKQEIELFVEIMKDNQGMPFSEIKKEKGYDGLVEEIKNKLSGNPKYQKLKEVYYKDDKEIMVVGNLFNRFAIISGVIGREYQKLKSQAAISEGAAKRSVPEDFRSNKLIGLLPENFSFDQLAEKKYQSR